MGNREAIIEKIAKVVGFPFSERELSPNLRTRIGELAKKQEQLQRLYDRKRVSEHELPVNRFLVRGLIALSMLPFSLGLIVMMINQVLGIILIIFGLFLLMSAVFTRKHFGTHESKTFKDLDMEILHFSREFEADIASFSRLVFNELSDTHKAKLSPAVRHIIVDFAEIVKAIKGKGILLESIECPHCGAPLSLPKNGESVQCSHCNRTILALDVFEKLKNVLS